MKLQDLVMGFGILGVLVLMILSYIPLMGMSFRSAGYAREKACYANMRVLLGAVEMYNMDHSVMMDFLNPKNASSLHRDGYLKTPINECPGDLSPRYSNAFIQARLETLSGNLRQPMFAYNRTAGGPYLGANLASDGRIVCSMHGTVD